MVTKFDPRAFTAIDLINRSEPTAGFLNSLLERFASPFQGITTGDNPRFVRFFWEMGHWGGGWLQFQSTGDLSAEFTGREQVFLWEDGKGSLAMTDSARVQGRSVWGIPGVTVRQMGSFAATLNEGSPWDMNSATFIPIEPSHLAAVWCFCSSKDFGAAVKRIDQSFKVTTATMGRVPFNVSYWQEIANKVYPHGLPSPSSDDPTQWLFHGHPQPSADPLQVAVARLAGYRWPSETDAAMELADEARIWIAGCDKLAAHTDDDGIVCLSSVRGEQPAHDRLLALLIDTWETVEPGSWKPTILDKLLAEADCSGRSLEVWLRDRFYEQHAKLFHHRPFIWHIWDGLKDGFGALVNYHKLDAKNLERLIHTYLGDWIRQQEEGVRNGADGAALRLSAAQNLEVRLQRILAGEAPYDIFVRWKPLNQQPIGWNPDLNDGVRLNIRPFMTAEVLRHNKKPKLNITWDKDRGKDVESASIAQEKGGRPFGVDSLRAIQLSKRDVLEVLAKARPGYTSDAWRWLLLRSMGFEPAELSERAQDALFLRMVPLVERNYNLVELGPRGTGKSHLFQQISPYAHLISGGKATVARMFVNNATGQRGLVCQYDVVCFDEVSGVSFDQKDGVNIMKGYMESGEFSRGKESIRADGSIVLVGNFDVDVEHQQRIGHLFAPLPPEMRNDTAFMDRIHAFVPGWDVPKLSPSLFTDHFGLVSDFLSECFTRLRGQSRVAALQGRVLWGGALSGRDLNAVNKTTSGLLKLMYPDASSAVSEADLEWAVRIALEARRRVKEQQKRIGAAEFRNTHFSYTIGAEGIEKFVATPELQSQSAIGDEPLECGQVWTMSPGGHDEHPGLFRIEVTEGPGGGVRVLNNPVPSAFRESIRYAEQNLYVRAAQLVGDRDPRAHEFSVQLRAFDAAKTGAKTGVAALIALASALLKRSVRGGLIIAGELTVGGTIEPLHNPVTLAELAVEKGAKVLLVPVSCRRQLFDLSDDMATRIDIEFYLDARDALLKAVG